MICAPTRRRSSGAIALTDATVPTGMNCGVSTSPCGSVSFPRRAAPSLCVTSNFTVLLRSPWTRKVAPSARLRSGSYDQHGVAVREKAIPLADGFCIGGLDPIEARESRHQHQERALRQVEVGQEPVYHAEFIAGRDEQVGGARTRPALRRLERPQRRGPDG